jgi:hypothetical protein
MNTPAQEVLYHPNVFMPAWFEMSDHIMSVTYSKHAKTAARTDRYGTIVLSATLDLSLCDVVEIGVTNRVATKIVVRAAYDNQYDIVVVFVPQGLDGFVKTVWLQEWDDDHKTLHTARYARS